MKSSSKLLVLSLTMAGFLLAGTAAKADPISIVLDSPFQIGQPGTSVTFDATLFNTDPTNTIYLNADSNNVDSPLTVDDSGFFNNAPFSLAPSSSSGDFELFTVDIPNGTPVGLYTGSFEILGGGPSDQNVVGTATFDVEITPEPGTLLLLGTGLLALGFLAERKALGMRI